MKLLEEGKKVLSTEEEALRFVRENLGEEFCRAVEEIFRCHGKVVLTGIGKSGLVARKISATLSSTGTPSIFIHAAEAVHGDLGTLSPEDIILAVSYSGESEEIKRLVYFVKRLGFRLISITGNPDSTLGRNSDIVINAKVPKEASPFGMVPTSSTTAAMALGDALAVALMIKRRFGKEDFAKFHPGGALGKKLLRVADLMHRGEELPVVREDSSLQEVVEEMSRKGFGTTAVVNGEGKLVGIITDGDLRRALLRDGEIFSKRAHQIMTRNPITIGKEELATRALKIMEERKITCLLVPDSQGRLEGLLHLHDLWRTELF